MRRLPPFAPEREEAELREYLGDAFDRRRLEGYEEQLDREFEQIGDEDRFYRSSNAYLYNLTAFAMTGTKRPYLDTLTRLVPPGGRVLDFGCGIGSDGLTLLEQGYQVEFADFDNPSTSYLRWRLERRGVEAPIHDLDRGVPGGFDLAYAFDVIEHVPDPFELLKALERCSSIVLVNLLEDEPQDTPLHRPLPISDLIDHAAENHLLHYRLHHGRSHLLAYRPGPGGGIAGRLRAARARRRSRRPPEAGRG